MTGKNKKREEVRGSRKDKDLRRGFIEEVKEREEVGEEGEGSGGDELIIHHVFNYSSNVNGWVVSSTTRTRFDEAVLPNRSWKSGIQDSSITNLMLIANNMIISVVK